MSTEELSGKSSLSVGGVDYKPDSTEITPEQHKENLRILRGIDAGLGSVAVRDQETREIQDVFREESDRHWSRCSAAEGCDREYNGFPDSDGYNNPVSYGDDRR